LSVICVSDPQGISPFLKMIKRTRGIFTDWGNGYPYSAWTPQSGHPSTEPPSTTSHTHLSHLGLIEVPYSDFALVLNYLSVSTATSGRREQVRGSFSPLQDSYRTLCICNVAVSNLRLCIISYYLILSSVLSLDCFSVSQR
jgi:hypothetical protein